MKHANPWFVRPHPKADAEFRLFCFHQAGVGPSAYRGWSANFSGRVEVCLLNLPGREGRLTESPHTSIRTLIPPLAEAVSGLLDKPYFCYGHSLGARIAFELSRELRRTERRQPAHLFVGASPAPQLPLQRAPMYEMGDEEFLAEIQRRYGGVPEQIMQDLELRSLLLPAMRADVTILETYRYLPEAPLDFPISVFGGLRDRMVTPSLLEPWKEQTTREFQLSMLDEDHFFTQSARPLLLENITAKIDGGPSIRSGELR